MSKAGLIAERGNCPLHRFGELRCSCTTDKTHKSMLTTQVVFSSTTCALEPLNFPDFFDWRCSIFRGTFLRAELETAAEEHRAHGLYAPGALSKKSCSAKSQRATGRSC